MAIETPPAPTALAKVDEPKLTPFEVIEQVISAGDIGKMTPEARVAFYWRTCETLGLNPLTQPFQYLSLNGKIVLYAKKDATEQLRRVNRVSVTGLERERDEALGIYTVYAHGRLPDGREDTASGIVNIKGMSGEALANQVMKAETKAKRRLTLSLVGLGFLDESEIEGLGDRIDVDPDTGEIVRPDRPAKPSLLDQVQAQAEAMAGAPVAKAPAPAESTSDGEFTLQVMTEDDSKRAGGMGDEPEGRAAVEDVEDQGAPEQAATARGTDEDEDIDEGEAERQLAVQEETEALARAQAMAAEEAKQPTNPLAPPGLTVAKLAELARDAGIGKMRFASVLDLVPADVGKRIEAMTDEERWNLGLQLGLVS